MEQGDYATLEKNIAEGNILDIDGEGYTPLHHAARLGNLQAIRLLVKAGADVHAFRDGTNQVLDPTPLSLALANSQFDAAKLLIDLGAADFEKAKVSSHIKKTYLDTGLIPIEQLLMPADVLIIYYGRYKKEPAIASYVELLKYLYQSGFKPTFRMIEMNYHGEMTADMLKVYLESGGKKFINETWEKGKGNTALFNQKNAESIKLLVEFGANPLKVNNKGNTPFHQAIDNVAQGGELYVKAWVKPLIAAGMNPFVKNNQGQTVLDYAYQVGNPLVINELKSYEQKYAMKGKVDKEFKTCEGSKALEAKANCYQAFASKYSDHAKASVAQKRYESLHKKRLVILEKKKKQQRLARIKRQACKLKNQDWEYLSKACKSGYAHGSGTAINEEKNLKFVGEFKAGLRVQGEIFAYGNLMYDGPLKNDRPHGKGICMHEGEPEDCNYYKGKRTDVLYKQRIEFAKQRELLASTEKRINDSLKETESNIDKKLANIQTGSGNVSQGATATDMVTEALKKKAADKAADFLFDQLF